MWMMGQSSSLRPLSPMNSRPGLWRYWCRFLPTLAANRSLGVSAEPPHGFQKFRIICVPQAAPVHVRAQFPNGGHELAGPHLGEDLRQLAQGHE
jgi:hypothetical protein